MKKIFVLSLTLLVASFAYAAKFYQVKLIYVNGKEVKGFAKFHKEPASEELIYKSSLESPETKIPSEKLKTLIYYFEEGKPVEFDRIRTWRYNLKKEKVVSDPLWLQVVLRGHATLYTASTEGSVMHSVRGASINPGDTYYFALRPGEDSGTLLHLQMHTTVMIMKNRMFRIIGADYFQDYKELSEKIANKEYKAKDLLTAVQEYNSWYLSQ